MKLKDAPEGLRELREAAREIKAAAVQQVIASRTAPEYRTLNGPTGGTRIQVGGAEFKTPANLAEWAARMITQAPADAVGSVLIHVLAAAARGDTAAAAVTPAGRLAEWDQWFLWNSLGQLPGGLADVDHVMAEIRREWRHLKLPTSRPHSLLHIEKNRPVFASSAGGTAYSPGTPEWAIPEGAKR